MALGVTAGFAAFGFLALYASTIGNYFAHDGCERVKRALGENVVGQDLAIEQIMDAVCAHLERNGSNTKPLVISLHGSPGVGKTLTHRILAQALYGVEGGPLSLMNSLRRSFEDYSDMFGKNVGFRDVVEEMRRMVSLQCPGPGCPGYKAVYGLDFLVSEKEEQVKVFRESIIQHVKKHREAVLVVEEYDKLSCDARGVLRQLFEHSEIAGVSMGRSIVLLESNLGTFELQNLVQELKGQKKRITPEQSQKRLKDLVFEYWTPSCEPAIDTIKMLNLVDFFLPYLPLGKADIRKIILLHLGAPTQKEHLHLSWGEEVVDFLQGRIVFEDGHPVDGGKEVNAVVTRHVGRALRLLELETPETVRTKHVHLRVLRSSNELQAIYRIETT